MYLPNLETSDFCYWLLESGYVRLTPARKTLYETIKLAADTQQQVTDIQWYNFLRASGYLFPVYVQSETLTAPNPWTILGVDNEIIQNPHFNGDSTWNHDNNCDGFMGSVHIYNNGGSIPLSTVVSLIKDSFYLISAMCLNGNGSDLIYQFDNDNTYILGIPNTDLIQTIYKATSNNAQLKLTTNNGINCELSYFSIKKILFT